VKGRRRSVWILSVGGAIFCGLFLGACSAARPGTHGRPRPEVNAFPLAHYQSGETTGTYSLWAPWPLFRIENTTESLTTALHPLFSWHKEHEGGRYDFHAVWPFLRRTYRPATFKGEQFKVFYLFPILYDGQGQVEGKPVSTRYLLPILYQGREGPHRHHFILFPFYWKARDARLIWPLFPQRPQTFYALWPIFGDFRGYWNRDRIQFLFWPLFVTSSKGRGKDQITIDSIVWPLTGFYSGKNVSGFRLWPLFSYVNKDDEWTRMYWLWPLGHHRTGLASDGRTTQSMTMFFPFYGHMRSAGFDYDLLFPFYGRLRSGKRTSTGYALAFYNTDHSERSGVIEHRLLWFVVRWRTRVEEPEREKPTEETAAPKTADLEVRPAGRAPAEGDTAKGATSEGTSAGRKAGEKSPPTGWAVFPLYGSMKSDQSIRQFALWPLYSRKWDRAKEFEFDRHYFVPFYSSQERRWNDGALSRSSFIFPLFKSSLRRDGASHCHALHLWWYDSLDGLDRNYAPLWTIYENNSYARTGVRRWSLMKHLYETETRADGERRSAFNMLLFSGDFTPNHEKVSIAWGLLGYEREQSKRSLRLLWAFRI